MKKMRAVLCTKYGEPNVLKLTEVKKPIPKENEILVKIHATAVTASDCLLRGLKVPGGHRFPMKQLMKFGMRVFIGFTKPRNPILGLVFSGVIEETNNITNFKLGDEVYGFTGVSRGTYAEYKCVSIKEVESGEIALKPKNASHQEAVAIVYGGVLAMHFMRNANIKKGQKVLIYGASGSNGTAAVQIAKYHGAQVTAVCSNKNFDLVKSLGAIKVIDYTSKEAINKLEKYDFILDAVGKNKTSRLKVASKTALTSNGSYASVDDGFLKIKLSYLKKLKTYFETGNFKAIIDRTYSLNDTEKAHEYVEEGHKKGNVIINVV
ncbi:NAD(P)-dependent alcohol dehydrogenase [uncultured Maribacter sp.]|uniref:NAD(P)-dependent alcohol dehydrogenase n=1 Tax=uncultured Maribacter sp. TaxID=431308 RepID=UPI002613C7A1|nr:NAD(P)-dependent alcohol dehydrogenase [uncultured Maribacter sp.]